MPPRMRPIDQSNKALADSIAQADRKFKIIDFLDGIYLKKNNSQGVDSDFIELAAGAEYIFPHNFNREPRGFIVTHCRTVAAGTLIIQEMSTGSYSGAGVDRKKYIWLKNTGGGTGLFRIWCF